jgi:hypothetical protein
MALRAKKLFGDREFESLADKDYYKAEDLEECVKNGVTPYVSKQTFSNGTGDPDFYSDKFRYNKEKKVYICPAGKELYYARDRKIVKKASLDTNIGIMKHAVAANLRIDVQKTKKEEQSADMSTRIFLIQLIHKLKQI